ncbi:LOW QUALITY PROTEIN: Coiled-coil domain-containing protein 88B [Galemys pyrenaicus]|uniref:Coiled-coil domain-containing protein 88B n=1 Tax=Galemys pyrenaicus TaxID=202257 RepID=A0A8J6DVY5_GALPY|nr:LOW QUALITY PROTEIN: Coiled-coil domain-containing protein 88B [Galemys pyrenaicus]
MDGGDGPRLRGFLSGSLATWALGLAGLVGEAEEPDEPKEDEEEEAGGLLCPQKSFLRLSDGALLLRVLGIIAPSSRGGPRMLRGRDSPAARRVRNLSHLWCRLGHFYQEELQLLILLPPPDLQTLGFDPFSEEAVEALDTILRLLLGASVQCEHRELFIRHIRGLSLEVQSELAAAIQQVTQPGAGLVLALAGPEPGDLAPLELEVLTRSLMGTLQRLARERDLGAQRLAELLLERDSVPLLPEAPTRTTPEGPSHHLTLQLANSKAQLRRLRLELEEKAELLLDSQAEVQGLEAEIRRLRAPGGPPLPPPAPPCCRSAPPAPPIPDRLDPSAPSQLCTLGQTQALSGQAKRAELYREEAEALRERAGRLPRLQEELRRCRERAQAAEACRGQLEEERVLAGALEASKALLEEQLEAAQDRCARLHETQRENLLLRTRLGEAHAELASLRHQVDQLMEENVELELELQRGLEPPPDSAGEVPLPGAAPSLHDEVREAEAGRLRSLELENLELRGLLQALQAQPPGQRPLLEEQSEDPVVPEPAAAAQPCPEDPRGPQGRADEAGAEGPPGLDLALPGSDAAPEGPAARSQAPAPDPQVQERPPQRAAPAAPAAPASGGMPLQSGPTAETQEPLGTAGHGPPPQTPASAARPQGPESRIPAEASAGAGPGQAEPEARGPSREGPGHVLGPSELGVPERPAEQDTPGPRLGLPEEQREARGHEQRPEGLAGQRTPHLQSEGAPGGEELARLSREAEVLHAELEAQARRLEARGAEAARLSEDLAQARKAEAEAHQEAQARAGELARLREAVEAAGRELEAASREREALAEALTASGRERRQWEREGPRLRARAEQAEERLQVLEGESRRRLEEVERERQERQALGEELEKAVQRGQELGARLERLQGELEQAALERQQFLRQQESQQERYQSLEQRLEAELRAAATSKEEALRELKTRALQLEEELLQLRQGPMGLGPEEQGEPRVEEAQSGRLIEVERNNATLVAEKAALQGQLRHLEGQLGSLQGRAQELLLQSQRAQEHSNRLQAEKSVLEVQGQELHRKLGVLEEEVQAARRSQEETRGQQQALLRDHEALAQLQRRQEAELEGLLVRHRDLKANMRALELAHRELQGRHEQLQAQKASVEAQEMALLAERERLMRDGHRQQGLEEELRRLQSEHDRAQVLLAEVSRERGELQGERGELRSRLARLELERAQLEAQSQRLRESNQQLDLSACRLTTQCELLTQLRSAQEEENRQLLAEVQALSKENRALLERSLESRDNLHREQREYLDQLNALRREKQKLVEKIMDQYRVLEPGPLPRTKKGSWLADKVKRLMRPRREGGLHGVPRLGADGAGSTESLGGPPEAELSEGREADGTGSSSPAPMRRAQSSLCLREEALAGGQRRKLSSRFQSFSPGDTPRQRFRQRRPGPLGAPSSHGEGPGLRWDSSVETLAEHEADADREATDTAWPGSRGGLSSRCWNRSGGPGQPRSLGSQGLWSWPLDKEACTGPRRCSWEEPEDGGDGWAPGAVPSRGSGRATRPSLRRWSLEDSPMEGGWRE